MNERDFTKMMVEICDDVLKPFLRDQIQQEVADLRAELNRQIRLEIRWRLEGALKDLSEP